MTLKKQDKTMNNNQAEQALKSVKVSTIPAIAMLLRKTQKLERRLFVMEAKIEEMEKRDKPAIHQFGDSTTEACSMDGEVLITNETIEFNTMIDSNDFPFIRV